MSASKTDDKVVINSRPKYKLLWLSLLYLLLSNFFCHQNNLIRRLHAYPMLKVISKEVILKCL